MADTTTKKTKQQGMSLNQRHLFLSASHSKPINSFSSSLLNNDVPSFSFDDSPSPPPSAAVKEQVANEVPGFNLDESPLENEPSSHSIAKESVNNQVPAFNLDYSSDRSSLSPVKEQINNQGSDFNLDDSSDHSSISPEEFNSEKSYSEIDEEKTNYTEEINSEKSYSGLEEDSSSENCVVSPKSSLAEVDYSSPFIEESKSEKSLSKLEKDTYTEKRAISPNTPLAEFNSSSPSIDDHFEVNHEDSMTKKDNTQSSPSHEQIERSVEETLKSSPLSSGAHSAEMKPTVFEFGSSQVSEKSVKNPEFSGESNFKFGSSGEGNKEKKVKIAGRRRLCKISAKNTDAEVAYEDLVDFESPVKNTVTSGGAANNDEVAYDFESPAQVKNTVSGGAANNSGGAANEIRDLLHDLTSKLDILSIEKTRPQKEIDSVKNKVNTVKKIDFQSSEDEFGKNCDWKNPLSGHAFFEKSNKIEKSNKSEIRNSKFEFSRSKISKLDEEDEDCMIVSGKKSVGGKKIMKSKYNLDDSSSSKVEDFGEAIFTETNDLFTLSDPKSSYKLPTGISKMLYPHQREGLKWLWSLHCKGKGGILGDDMGLGKTMQICGFLTGLFHSKLIKRVLIVAPKTLLPHWIKELSAVGLSHMTKEYYGTCAKARQYELAYVLQGKGVLLTTYDIVRNNVNALSGNDRYNDEEDEDDYVWDYMILDEGHLIKNPSTQRAKSLLAVPCARRIIISGTPIQNNLKELWALFNFSCPGLLGDKKWFKEKYENHILRANNKDASDREKRIGSTVAKELREKIQPYFLRRMKNEVFLQSDETGDNTLSKKNEIIVWLKLTSSQRHLYAAFLNSKIVVSSKDKSPLAALTILKKICDHPLLLTKRAGEAVLEKMDSNLNEEDYAKAEELARYLADAAQKFDITGKQEISCKISFIMSLLDNLIPEGHNVLIFSQTRKMLNLIEDALLLRGYGFMRIDGTTKANDRLKIVEEFQEGNGAPIFLLTSQVGGLGLTLTNADRVIVVDPAWNPSTDNQSVDRAYRIGQTKDVIVYRLMTCSTVEEKIYRKQVFKGGLFKTATEHKQQISYFTQQDLKDIFRLPEHGFDISMTQLQLQEEHGHQNTMDDSLKNHIKFLESLGIAGVSDHNLLFSKTATIPEGGDDDEEPTRVRKNIYMGNSSLSSSLEHNVNGAEYAFNPKDVKLQHRSFTPRLSEREIRENEIREKIKSLTRTLANKDTIERLADKGKRMEDLLNNYKSELYILQMGEEENKNEVIDLDDDKISGEFQRVLNV